MFRFHRVECRFGIFESLYRIPNYNVAHPIFSLKQATLYLLVGLSVGLSISWLRVFLIRGIQANKFKQRCAQREGQDIIHLLLFIYYHSDIIIQILLFI